MILCTAIINAGHSRYPPIYLFNPRTNSKSQLKVFLGYAELRIYYEPKQDVSMT